MCDCPVPLTGTRWAKKCQKKEVKKPLVCFTADPVPRMITMVRWSPPELLESRNVLGRIPQPNGGYARYIPEPGFPLKPKIPGIFVPSTVSEDPDMSPEEIRQVLNVLFPPLLWDENERTWRQEVSQIPANRMEVAMLAEELEVTLLRSQARKNGICPMRQYLFFQCFDELIRQVTIQCAERGLLLRQVKEEIQLILTAYKHLVEAAIKFGAKKFEETKDLEGKLKQEYEELLKVKKNLEWEHQEAKLRLKQSARTHKEQKKHLEQMRNMKLAYIQRSNDQFFYMLDNIGADKKFYFHLI